MIAANLINAVIQPQIFGEVNMSKSITSAVRSFIEATATGSFWDIEQIIEDTILEHVSQGLTEFSSSLAQDCTFEYSEHLRRIDTIESQADNSGLVW